MNVNLEELQKAMTALRVMLGKSVDGELTQSETEFMNAHYERVEALYEAATHLYPRGDKQKQLLRRLSHEQISDGIASIDAVLHK